MNWRPRFSKILKRVLVVAGALVVLLVVLVSLGLGTRVGRNLLLVRALAFVNDAIPGRVQVLDFNEFSFSSLELNGITVFDPAGAQVLSLRTLRLEGSWVALRASDLRLTRARLHEGFVDASNIEQKRRGLVAAFVDPDAPPTPPSTAPPPYVLVKQIEIDAVAVRLPRPSAVAPEEIRRLSLRGGFELDRTPRAQVDSLTFVVQRDAEQIANLSQLKALLGRGKEASNLALVADLAGARLELTASGVAPPDASWRSAPLKARVKLAGVTSARVARLTGDASLRNAFLGASDLELGVSGSLRSLAATLALGSAAGKLQLQATLAEQRDLRFDLATAGLTPSRLQPQAPAHTLAAALRGRVDISRAPESFRVHELKLSDASIDGEALPQLDASALVSQRDLKQLKLELRDAVSHVKLAGDAGFDGSAKLTINARIFRETLRRLALLAGQRRALDGTLSVDLDVERTANGRIQAKGAVDGRQLVFDQTSLARAAIELDLAGTPPELSGAVDVRLERLTAGDVVVSSAGLDVRGGPRRYAIGLRARSNQGDVDLSTRLVREAAGSVLVEATATGVRSGQPVALVVRPTRLSPAGSVATEGIRASIAGQELEVRGSATATNSALEIEAKQIDLAALNALVKLKEKLRGSVSLQAGLRGKWQRPEVVVLLDGRGVTMGERPELDLSLSGRLDAPEGFGDVKLRLTDTLKPQRKHRLVAAFDAEARFSTQEPLSRAFENAEYRALLDLEKLELGFVQAHLPKETTLPVAGTVNAKLEVSGRATAPAVALHMAAKLDPTWSKRRLEVSHDLVLESGRLGADLQISDAAGVWVDVNASTSLPPFDQIPEQAAKLAQQERWRVKLSLAERELEQLPVPEDQRSSLPAASVAGSLDAAHEPGQEPELELVLVLRQKRGIETAPGCIAKDLRVDTDVSLARGDVAVRLLARQAQRELVNLDAKARLLVGDALGGGKAELGRITAKLKSSDLELRTLPFVCQRFGGRVNLAAHLDDPLGARPDVALSLKIGNLSAGSKTSVDTSLDLFVKPDQAGLDAKVRHGVNTSIATLRVPVKLGAGRLKIDEQAPLRGELRLRHLPIEPFLDPEGAVSYATGTLSGQAKVAGTLKSPRVQGAIDLEDLGFTATDMAQPLRNIEGQVRFSERRVELKGFEAHDRDGVVKLDGSVDFANLERVQGDFRVRAKEFPMRQQGQVVATTDVDARIKSTLTPRKSQVKILLREVDTWLETAPVRQGIALAGHQDVVVNGQPAVPPARKQDEPKPTARERPPRTGKPPSPSQPKPNGSTKVTEILLDARDKFWVKRDDFAVKLAALVTARIIGEDVWVEGNVEIDRGYLQLFGKVFEIERGSELEFIGSPEPNPVLDIRAVHENRRSGQSVKVQITGRGSAPVLTFFVDDVVVTAGDAFVALFGAQRSNEDPEAAGDQAKNFVGGLTAGVLATAARRELGAAAPILMVEPGGGTEETRVRAGFELDSIVPRFLRPIVTGMYFEGIVANDQNANTQDANVHGGALLEIYFPRDFFTTGQYGPGTTWSVDLGWQL
ncbi:MAG TPA: translocation/assembly module TamB domain-containing protein [Polyangiaceae bacterium]